jgi:hypothetical protein
MRNENMKRIRKFKKDFELDLLLAVDELLNEPNVCFGGIPILLEMKDREYFQDAKDEEKLANMIERYVKSIDVE